MFICQPELTGGAHSVTRSLVMGETKVSSVDLQSPNVFGFMKVNKNEASRMINSDFLSPEPNKKAVPVRTKNRVNDPCKFAHAQPIKMSAQGNFFFTFMPF